MAIDYFEFDTNVRVGHFLTHPLPHIRLTLNEISDVFRKFKDLSDKKRHVKD